MKYSVLIFTFFQIFFGVFATAQTAPPPPDYVSPDAARINYVRTWDLLKPVQDAAEALDLYSEQEVRQTTQFIDGLGRPLQTVIKKGSYDSKNEVTADLVSPIVYDELGRQQYQYLPFASNNVGDDNIFNIDDGEFKSTPFKQQQYFYSDQNIASPIKGQGETEYYNKTIFENSPLNRPVKSFASGNSWAGNGIGTSIGYWNNTVNDNVKIWKVNGYDNYEITGYYKAGLLSKTITEDEQGHKIVEFKDRDGKVILKKVQQADAAPSDGSGYDEWLCTYYVYDDFNQLRLVVPPKAVKILKEDNWNNGLLTTDFTERLCFKYEYDNRNRMVIKQVPGAAPVNMLYDKWDRLVLTQDGNQALQHQWMYTKYDCFNRPVYTGIIAIVATREQLQGELDGSTLGRYETFAAGSGIQYTLNQSFPVLSQVQKILTVTYYDNYAFANFLNTEFAKKNDETDANFNTDIDQAPLYAQPLIQSNQTEGMVTGRIVYTLSDNSSVPLSSAVFYDDKGRVLQTIGDNISGDIDISTTQYNFSGQVLKNVLRHRLKKNATDVVITTAITTYDYDKLSRLLQVKKKIKHGIYNNKYEAPEKIIVYNVYNSLGQLQSKGLGLSKNKNDETKTLETLNYDYNIRGWLTGINKNYIADPETYPSYFGMELAYDKNTAADITTTYSEPQLNGNIAGTIWRTKGDEVSRKYDFKYDNVNRLLEANFVQKGKDESNNINWNHNSVDFSVLIGNGVTSPTSHFDPTAYDENGNILGMQQWGLKLNSSIKIDELKYTYKFNGQSNQLLNVVDKANDINTKLGDFRTSAEHSDFNNKQNLQAGGTNAQYQLIKDYDYDANGNLTEDQNKDILSISYNILNLPQVITLKNGWGSITYLYDAEGNKLRKTTNDAKSPNKTITTVTKYIAGFIYESKSTSYLNGDVPVDAAPDYTDQLQYFAHEEGRVRYNGVTIGQTEKGLEPTFAFDYFVKDHLGNIRMVLTDEGKEDKYPAATLETDNITSEKQFYKIPDYEGVTVNKNTVPGYPDDNTTSPNEKIQKLKGVATKIGTSIVLKVMAGDKFNVKVSSWYKTNSVSPSEPVSPLNDLLTSLASGVAAASVGGSHVVTEEQLYNSNVLSPGLSSFLGDPEQINPDASRPKAYLNWILFDEQFQYVSSSSGAEQVPAESYFRNGTSFAQVYQHARTDLPITKNGYLYVYVSNETPNISVYFDNLQVTHYRGVIFEETHYYPFGLAMSGISSKASGLIPNKSMFNGGNELQSAEFSDGSGLELYDAVHRMYDPQLGRFWQIDELSESNWEVSPYNFASDNPLRYNDPLGLKDADPKDDPKGKLRKTKWLREVVIRTKAKPLKVEDKFALYYKLKDEGISFEKIKAPKLRAWMYKQDEIFAYMHEVHQGVREDGMMLLEFGSWFIPAGEILKVKYLGKALNLLRFKKGAAVAEGAVAVEEAVVQAAFTKSGGRLGTAATRSQIQKIAAELKSRGYTIEGGGMEAAEEYLKPLGGGRKGGSFLDITAKHPNYPTLRINTVDVLKDGVTPTARELRNAARIRTQIGPGEHLILIPKR